MVMSQPVVVAAGSHDSFHTASELGPLVDFK
jgi:hypothetical protein